MVMAQDRRKDLAGDYTRVSGTEMARQPVEDNIQFYAATAQEIVNWYFAKDPLSEFEILQFIKYKNGDLKARDDHAFWDEYRNVAYEKAGAALVAQTIFPEFYTDGLDKGYDRLEEAFFQEIPKEEIVDPDAVLSPDDIMGLAFRKIDNMGLSNEQLKNLFLAAEMFSFASTLGEARKTHLDLSSHTVDWYMSMRLFELISDRALKSADLNTRILGVKAEWQKISPSIAVSKTKVEHLKPKIYKDAEQQLYLEMISALETAFLADSGVNLNAGDIRGQLHELIWFLDFNILLRHEDAGNNFMILPARSFQDAPRIGYPQNNRGFDYHVNDVWGKTNLLIQLKSKEQPYKKKTYHPLITVIGEKNFSDTDQRRLSYKLNAYRSFIETGSEQSWQNAKRYILGSVSEFWQTLPLEQPSVPERLVSAYENGQNLPKNKSARRRLMKDLKKRGLQIH